MQSFGHPSLFINRELSMLAFQQRVLSEAQDERNALYDRLRFLGIVASNVDEFFMVRVAGIKQQQLSGISDRSLDDKSPLEQLQQIADAAHALNTDHYAVAQHVMAQLRDAGVRVVSPTELDPTSAAALRDHFQANIFPALTPLAIDPGHPFPHLRNKSLNVALLLRRRVVEPKRRKNSRTEGVPTDVQLSLAVVQVPVVLPRLVSVAVTDPAAIGGIVHVPLEEVIAWQASELFPGFQVAESAFFRVTRNWDISVDEDEQEDLLQAIQDELRRRDRGAAVRLELAAPMGASKDGRPGVLADEMERTLAHALHVEKIEVYRVNGPLQLQDLSSLVELDPRPELHGEPLTAAVHPAFRDIDSVFPVFRDRDVLVHHPYESFDPVVRFIEEAADDPNVLAIKQTLYRTSWNSPFVRALSRAAENGKQVAVLVEIKARFDEANNIAWARRLEEAGVHVVYGLIGLKTHCKVALVVRREGAAIKRYVHLGTGNYNPSTARVYTDLSLFTARSDMADDASALFNMLTGLSDAPRWKRLAVAPLNLLDRLLFLIQRESDKAQRGEPGRIIAKMNALVDPTIIQALYAASCAGVEIDLIVRGMCSLRPGIAGISERIRVRSIVDRFLEHHRIAVFGVGVAAEVYLSSADWMTRNFARRIETMFPIEDAALRARVMEEILQTHLSDNIKAHVLQADGSWQRASAGAGTVVRSQQALLHLAHATGDRTSRRDTGRISLAPRAVVPTGTN